VLVDDLGRPWPPTLEVVLAAGYSEEGARKIVAEEQAKFDRGERPLVAETQEEARRLSAREHRRAVGETDPEEETMKFHSIADRVAKDHPAHGKPLDFELGGIRYKVPLKGECDIPSKFAFSVKSRGLPLEQGPHPDSSPERPAPRAEQRQEVQPRPVRPVVVDDGADPDEDDDVPDDDDVTTDDNPIQRAVAQIKRPPRAARAAASADKE